VRQENGTGEARCDVVMKVMVNEKEYIQKPKCYWFEYTTGACMLRRDRPYERKYCAVEGEICCYVCVKRISCDLGCSCAKLSDDTCTSENRVHGECEWDKMCCIECNIAINCPLKCDMVSWVATGDH
jgi:hypothetical protein